MNGLFECSCQGNSVQLTIGGQWYNIGTGVGERNSYEIYILQEAEEGDEDYNFIEKEIYRHLIELSDEEWEAAQEYTFEDIEFETRIDKLLAAKITKDMLRYCVRNIEKTLYYSNGLKGQDFDFDRYEKKWEKYFKMLLHKRMKGELVAPYIPGYEPKDTLSPTTTVTENKL